MTTNTTADCETCVHCVLDESNPSKILCYCQLDDRYRIFGSYLNCDRKEEKREE